MQCNRLEKGNLIACLSQGDPSKKIFFETMINILLTNKVQQENTKTNNSNNNNINLNSASTSDKVFTFNNQNTSKPLSSYDMRSEKTRNLNTELSYPSTATKAYFLNNSVYSVNQTPFLQKTNHIYLTNNFIDSAIGGIRKGDYKRLSVAGSALKKGSKIPVYRNKESKNKNIGKTMKIIQSCDLKSRYNLMNSELHAKHSGKQQRKDILPGVISFNTPQKEPIKIQNQPSSYSLVRNDTRSKTQITNISNNNVSKDKSSVNQLTKTGTRLKLMKFKTKKENNNVIKKSSIADIKRLMRPTASSNLKTNKVL